MAFLPGDEDHRVQRLILIPYSQTRFFKIENLSTIMQMHMCVLLLSSYLKMFFSREN